MTRLLHGYGYRSAVEEEQENDVDELFATNFFFASKPSERIGRWTPETAVSRLLRLDVEPPPVFKGQFNPDILLETFKAIRDFGK